MRWSWPVSFCLAAQSFTLAGICYHFKCNFAAISSQQNSRRRNACLPMLYSSFPRNLTVILPRKWPAPLRLCRELSKRHVVKQAKTFKGRQLLPLSQETPQQDSSSVTLPQSSITNQSLESALPAAAYPRITPGPKLEWLRWDSAAERQQGNAGIGSFGKQQPGLCAGQNFLELCRRSGGVGAEVLVLLSQFLYPVADAWVPLVRLHEVLHLLDDAGRRKDILLGKQSSISWQTHEADPNQLAPTPAAQHAHSLPSHACCVLLFEVVDP